jgi:hypothetical protein
VSMVSLAQTCFPTQKTLASPDQRHWPGPDSLIDAITSTHEIEVFVGRSLADDMDRGAPDLVVGLYGTPSTDVADLSADVSWTNPDGLDGLHQRHMAFISIYLFLPP